jgi:hypothetical protein
MLLALTQVETVALWTGLISAIVSIVLSVIAIAFARDVDHRSLETTHETIRSLETIRSTVQRLSDDTGGLIKVAWERMLGTMGPGPSAHELHDVVSGLVNEFRQDAGELNAGTQVDRLAQNMAERVRRATSGGNGAGPEPAPRGWAFNAAVQAIESLSQPAIEILRVLDEGLCLRRSQYQSLKADPELALALEELRDHDLLIPFHRRGPKADETVYGLAPWFVGVTGPALVFTGHETPSTTVAERVRTALASVTDQGAPA